MFVCVWCTRGQGKHHTDFLLCSITGNASIILIAPLAFSFLLLNHCSLYFGLLLTYDPTSIIAIEYALPCFCILRLSLQDVMCIWQDITVFFPTLHFLNWIMPNQIDKIYSGPDCAPGPLNIVPLNGIFCSTTLPTTYSKQAGLRMFFIIRSTNQTRPLASAYFEMAWRRPIIFCYFTVYKIRPIGDAVPRADQSEDHRAVEGRHRAGPIRLNVEFKRWARAVLRRLWGGSNKCGRVLEIWNQARAHTTS